MNELLTNEPFSLMPEQAEEVIEYIYESNEAGSTNSIPIKVFTARIKHYILDFTLLPEK